MFQCGKERNLNLARFLEGLGYYWRIILNLAFKSRDWGHGLIWLRIWTSVGLL
jgi:hypothetical protein